MRETEKKQLFHLPPHIYRENNVATNLNQIKVVKAAIPKWGRNHIISKPWSISEKFNFILKLECIHHSFIYVWMYEVCDEYSNSIQTPVKSHGKDRAQANTVVEFNMQTNSGKAILTVRSHFVIWLKISANCWNMCVIEIPFELRKMMEQVIEEAKSVLFSGRRKKRSIIVRGWKDLRMKKDAGQALKWMEQFDLFPYKLNQTKKKTNNRQPHIRR